jgi:hypothetical protein
MSREREVHESKPANRFAPEKFPEHAGISKGTHPEHSTPIHTDRPNTKRSDEISHLATNGNPHHTTNSSRFPQSPIVSNPTHLSKEHLPPKSHVAPQPDLRIQAKPGQIHTGAPSGKPATSHREIRPTNAQHHPGGGEERKRI